MTECINCGKVFEGLTRGGIIILSPVGVDPTGIVKFNVNADVAAAAVAKATGSMLVFLTGEKGLLDDQGAVIEKVNIETTKAMIEDGSIKGGMIVKAEMIMDVLTQSEGVSILNGETSGSITGLVRDSKINGTLFTR